MIYLPQQMAPCLFLLSPASNGSISDSFEYNDNQSAHHIKHTSGRACCAVPLLDDSNSAFYI
jgi:hypothetical protein